MYSNLGQYFTEDKFSNLLVSSLKLQTPKTILELGVGGGSLAKAATNRWKNAHFIATEIDHYRILQLKETLPNISVSNIDGLSPNIEQQLNIIAGNIDIAVCNPPYTPLKKNEKYLNILKDAGFKSSCKLGRLTTDIIFLAQNLKMLKPDGELGIILPDTILTGSEFQLFREDILDNSSVTGLIQLPPNAFCKTEARTHILFLQKGQKKASTVKIKQANLEGKITSQIKVNQSSLIKRMDFSYHAFTQKLQINTGVSLKDIDAEIFRGKYSKKKLIEFLGRSNFFHTTSFKQGYENGIAFNNTKPISSNFAQTGDILIARVGRGSIGKITFVKSGKIEVSDCVIVLRVRKRYRSQIYEALVSEIGQSWLYAYSHGVCSRFITKQDLLDFRFNP